MAVSFIGEGNQSTRRKPPACCKSLTNFITWCLLYWVHLTWVGFEPTTLVVIGTGCIGSHKSTTLLMPNIANDFIHILSLPGKRLIRVGGNEIWLYFPSCIIGTCDLTVFPIMHYRNTRLDCISHHELYIRTGIVGHTRFDCVSHHALKEHVIWLCFSSYIIGTRYLTVFPIMHYRITRFDCIFHHIL